MEGIIVFLEYISPYFAMWAPSLIAVLGIATTVLCALSKVKAAITEFKKEDVMTELTNQLKEQNKLNEELVRTNKLLLDDISRVRKYADIRKHEISGEGGLDDNHE